MSRQGNGSRLVCLLFLAGMLLAGCGGAKSPSTATGGAGTLNRQKSVPAATTAPAGQTAPAAGEQDGLTNAEKPGAGPQPTPVAENVIFSSDPNRKIIKNADLSIEVETVETVLSRIGGGAAQLGGYVLDTRTDFGDGGARSAVIQLAVPVEQFEAMLQRIREMGTVLSEQSSGTDVSQEYVDVQSQIANLEATQARVRQFLEQARSVEEALQVNAQLTELEGQISQLKGRLQYLSQRAAYSTITVQLRQAPSAAVPTPTPTPTPVVVWNPDQTVTQAYATLQAIVQAVATVGIWLAVVVLPLVLPFVLALLAVRALRTRRQAQQRPPSAPLAKDAPAGGAE